MSARPQLKRLYTEEEYFALEEASEIKHEFYRGEIFAMTGGTVNHNRITRNVLTALDSRLQGGRCEAFGSDLRVWIEAHSLYTYPDVLVVCGGVDIADRRNDTITNPQVIVEVLSPSTQAYDQGEKFVFYRTIPTLQEYVLIHQETPHIIHYRKQAEGWLLTDLLSIDDRLTLSSLNVEIPLQRIYDRVDWL
ncbi:MAG: Uma2 family endonuclease [Caldilineaceae bacterium]|nr:Uma2 family endonuclease [Caldilineaceae bacterium]